MPGAAFWWSGRVLGIYYNIAALAGLPGRGPKREGMRSGEGKPRFLGLPNNLQTGLQDYRTTGLQDYRTADLNFRFTAWWPQGGRRIYIYINIYICLCNGSM